MLNKRCRFFKFNACYKQGLAQKNFAHICNHGFVGGILEAGNKRVVAVYFEDWFEFRAGLTHGFHHLDHLVAWVVFVYYDAAWVVAAQSLAEFKLLYLFAQSLLNLFCYRLELFFLFFGFFFVVY